MWCLSSSAPVRCAVLSAALAVAAACGFAPLYGAKGGAAPERLAEIRIAPIADRVGQTLHNLLLDKMNPAGPPRHPLYVLSVSLTESTQGLAVRKDEVATRANLIISAKFSLIRIDDDNPALTGSIVSTNSYNILSSDFATLSSEHDARNRAVREISDEIKTRIAIFLNGLT